MRTPDLEQRQREAQRRWCSRNREKKIAQVLKRYHAKRQTQQEAQP